MHPIHKKQSLNLRVRVFFFLITLLFSVITMAQIVDDSTRLVYGPNTTSFTTEFDLLNNTGTYHSLDTSIYRFERQSYYAKSGRRYQDLGSFGTALFPIFYTPQESIGRTSGFNAYDAFAYQPSDLKYFDTKSPFIDLFVLLGGANRNIVKLGFSRNVNENWNLGFDLKKITTNKQLAPQNQTDRQVVGTSFTGYTHYKHPNVPYQIALHYSSMNHEFVELGGARPTSDSLRTDFFLFDNALVRLDDAQGNVKTVRWHAYQDYQIAKQFQLYHIFDYRRETNIYTDFTGSTAAGGYDPYTDFYQDFLIDPDSTYERNVLTTLSNEAGIKGNISSAFYRFYARVRSVDWEYLFYRPGDKVIETYLGGHIRFNWREKFAVTGNAEYLLGGEYKIGGTLTSDLISVNYQSMKYRVPFLFADYFGNHHEWHNNFSSVFSNQLEAQLNVKIKSFEVRPKVSLTSYNNFIYLDQDITPIQTNDPLLISSIGGDFNLRILNKKGEGWNLENEVLATTVSGDDADKLRIPDIFYNGRFFWRGNWFKDLVPVEAGIDIHGRSSYFANAYAPEIQQFYLQDSQEVFGDVVTDLFVNMKVDKFFFSLKWNYFNQPQDDGYFVSPNFPGQRRVIDLTVRWMFFD